MLGQLWTVILAAGVEWRLAEVIPRDVLTLYLAANAFALATLAIAFWSREAARWIGVGVFAWAAAINTRTALVNPSIYLEYADLTPSLHYRSFILGWFNEHVQLVVLAIAAGQLTIATLLALPSRTCRRIGVAGAVIFLLAIAPLGLGAGFPFSLTFGVALLVSVGAGAVESPSVRQAIHWSPRLLGLLLVVLLTALALDAFHGPVLWLDAFQTLVLHLLPAAVVLGVLTSAWWWPRVGGAICFALAIVYGAMSNGRISWMVAISAPLVVIGALFLWSSRLPRWPPRATR